MLDPIGATRRRLLAAALATLAATTPALAVEGADRNAGGYETREIAVATPAATLVSAEGEPVSAAAALSGDGPMMLNFLFTTCTTVCPILGASFADAQERLIADGREVALVSISIDPEHDTPAVLRSFAEAYDAQTGWRFYTGQPAEIDALQRAFDAYRGSKFTHRPLTFIRADSGGNWLRVEGYAGADALIDELDRLLER